MLIQYIGTEIRYSLFLYIFHICLMNAALLKSLSGEEPNLGAYYSNLPAEPACFLTGTVSRFALDIRIHFAV
jgi:hypothetical protein